MQLLCSIIHGFIFKNIKKKYYSEFIDAISVFINLNHQYNWITKLEAILINPRNKELLSVTHTLSPFFLINRFIPSKKNILHFFPFGKKCKIFFSCSRSKVFDLTPATRKQNTPY